MSFHRLQEKNGLYNRFPIQSLSLLKTELPQKVFYIIVVLPDDYCRQQDCRIEPVGRKPLPGISGSAAAQGAGAAIFFTAA